MELAAYIDRVLGKAEAARVTEHLVSCERCYEVYAETVHFKLESEPVSTQGEVVFFPPPPWEKQDRKRSPWLTVAAALLVFGLAGGLYRSLFAPPSLTTTLATGQISKALQQNSNLAESFWLGPTLRGGGEDREISLDPAAIQIGVQLINLQVSLEANDRGQASDAIARLLQVLKTQIGLNFLEKEYIELNKKIWDSGTPRDHIMEALGLEFMTRAYYGPDATHLDFGRWVEAGRLAAIAQEPSFFQQNGNRQFLRRLLWRQRLGIGDMTIDPAALQALRDISDVLGNRDLRPEDYASLRQSFDKILEIYYPA
jgi:hypothetical protein